MFDYSFSDTNNHNVSDHDTWLLHVWIVDPQHASTEETMYTAEQPSLVGIVCKGIMRIFQVKNAKKIAKNIIFSKFRDFCPFRNACSPWCCY